MAMKSWFLGGSDPHWCDVIFRTKEAVVKIFVAPEKKLDAFLPLFTVRASSGVTLY